MLFFKAFKSLWQGFKIKCVWKRRQVDQGILKQFAVIQNNETKKLQGLDRKDWKIVI